MVEDAEADRHRSEPVGSNSLCWGDWEQDSGSTEVSSHPPTSLVRVLLLSQVWVIPCNTSRRRRNMTRPLYSYCSFCGLRGGPTASPYRAEVGSRLCQTETTYKVNLNFYLEKQISTKKCKVSMKTE